MTVTRAVVARMISTVWSPRLFSGFINRSSWNMNIVSTNLHPAILLSTQHDWPARPSWWWGGSCACSCSWWGSSCRRCPSCRTRRWWSRRRGSRAPPPSLHSVQCPVYVQGGDHLYTDATTQPPPPGLPLPAWHSPQTSTSTLLLLLANSVQCNNVTIVQISLDITHFGTLLTVAWYHLTHPSHQ